MKKTSILDISFNIINYTIFTVFMILCIYPFYYLLIGSLSDPVKAAQITPYLWPSGFTFDNFITIFKLPGIGLAFLVSASRAVFGTIVTIFFSSLLGYVLSKKEMPFRQLIYRITVISMYLSAGLIPYYILMKKLGLQNNYLLYILPGAVSAYFMILIKTYIEQIPPALEESALVDGASYLVIYRKIVMPLCKPIIAAIAVFSAVGQWNSWFDNFLLVQNVKLTTLQLVLWRFLSKADAIARAAQTAHDSNALNNTLKMSVITPLSVKITTTMIVTIPIILVYPALQKYFVKGIMLGAVKG